MRENEKKRCPGSGHAGKPPERRTPSSTTNGPAGGQPPEIPSDALDVDGELSTSWQSLKRVIVAVLDCASQQAEAIARLEATMGEASSRTDAIGADLSMVMDSVNDQRKCAFAQAALLREMDGKVGSLEHNLEQLRRQCDRIAETTEKLADEFIHREVISPIFRDVVGFVFRLERVGLNGNGWADDVEALVQEMEQFMARHRMQILRARAGERFDPRRDQPIHRVLTSDAALAGTIRRVFCSGLISRERVIQPTRVEIYVYTPETGKEGACHERDDS